MSNDIVVIGSINMDIVIKTKEIPKIGETVMGREMIETPGGKGANQAVALAKLGTQVSFLGMIGNDLYGNKILLSMKESGVNIDYIKSVEGSSGLAFITVDDKGNNNIIVIPGANYKMNNQYLHNHIDVISRSKVVLLQNEIPIDIVKDAIILSKNLGKIIVLNPAPVSGLEEEILKYIDILIPNEYELARISGKEIKSIESVVEACKYLIYKGVPKIITTLGDKGAIYVDKTIVKHFKAFSSNVLDTTAAGDSFIGGFLSSFILTNDMFKSIEFGQKAAAITIQRFGAQQALPTLEEINKYDSSNISVG